MRRPAEASTHIEFASRRFLSGGSGNRLTVSMKGREPRPSESFNSNDPGTHQHSEEAHTPDGGVIEE